MGFLSSEHQHGFLGHFTLAVSADGRRTPLGVMGIETSLDRFVRGRETTLLGRRTRIESRCGGIDVLSGPAESWEIRQFTWRTPKRISTN